MANKIKTPKAPTVPEAGAQQPPSSLVSVAPPPPPSTPAKAFTKTFELKRVSAASLRHTGSVLLLHDGVRFYNLPAGNGKVMVTITIS